MTENVAILENQYIEKARKRNVYGCFVTPSYIVTMHGTTYQTACRWLKKCRVRMQKKNISISDWALHLGYISVEKYEIEIGRNLK